MQPAFVSFFGSNQPYRINFGAHRFRASLYSRDYDYSNKTVWAENKLGQLIDIGGYPNSLDLYYEDLDELKKVFRFRDEVLKTAKDR